VSNVVSAKHKNFLRRKKINSPEEKKAKRKKKHENTRKYTQKQSRDTFAARSFVVARSSSSSFKLALSVSLSSVLSFSLERERERETEKQRERAESDILKSLLSHNTLSQKSKETFFFPILFKERKKERKKEATYCASDSRTKRERRERETRESDSRASSSFFFFQHALSVFWFLLGCL